MAAARPQKFLIGAVMYTLFFAGATETIKERDTDNKCGGEERWEQKVLIDPESENIDETPHTTTIQELRSINTKSKKNKYEEGKSRMEIEQSVYRIEHCFITDIIHEKDNDLHLVIEDGNKNTMIAEIVDPKCPKAKKSKWEQEFLTVKQKMMQYASSFRHYQFTITGVLFVDKAHGQTGLAPNAVELHPIIDLKVERKINPILK